MSHAGSASLPWAAPKSCAVECATYRHSSRGTMEDVQRGESRLRLHAIAEIDRKADIPGPQRVASLAMALARLVGLHDAMHREGARASPGPPAPCHGLGPWAGGPAAQTVALPESARRSRPRVGRWASHPTKP